MKNILIDTDVILDFFFDRKPFSENSALILTMCENKLVKGSITPVICSNIYYLLRKTAQHEKVVDKLKLLLSMLDVMVMDKEIVFQALNSSFNDFEDALQNYSAIKNGSIEAIITRNTKDYKNSTIGALTPENYLKTVGMNK